MTFKKYPSITNSYDKKFIAKIKEQHPDEDNFIVYEKLHGANIQISVDERGDIKIGRRNAYLEDGERFYNYKHAIEPHLSAIKRMHAEHGGLPFTLYGELIGGSYPHPEVSKIDDMVKVQRGIHYHAYNKIIFFDFMLNNHFANESLARELFRYYNLHYCDPLYAGPLNKCLAYKNEFPTTIPSIFGLPEIENNICEGVVIKPENPLFLSCGSRVILKNKNDRFKEINHKKEKKPTTPINYDAVETYLLDITRYMTMPRIDAVVSKEGENIIKNTQKLCGLYARDIIADYIKDNGPLNLEKEEMRMLKTRIFNEAMVTIEAWEFVND